MDPGQKIVYYRTANWFNILCTMFWTFDEIFVDRVKRTLLKNETNKGGIKIPSTSESPPFPRVNYPITATHANQSEIKTVHSKQALIIGIRIVPKGSSDAVWGNWFNWRSVSSLCKWALSGPVCSTTEPSAAIYHNKASGGECRVPVLKATDNHGWTAGIMHLMYDCLLLSD